MFLIVRILIILFVVVLACPSYLMAQDVAGTDDSFSFNVRALTFFDAQSPARSTQNPNNSFLNLYRYSGEAQVRPDFFFEKTALSAVFKPRLVSSYRWREAGAANEENPWQNKGFVNEWRLQVQPFSQFYLSFGKEKLLWGPSFLANPSNLLFKDTEKANPYTEVEGKYLAKIVYVPSAAVTVSLIAETQERVNVLKEKVQPLQALKIDCMGSNFLLSLIGYSWIDDRFRMGSFGQWTVSDALVLYYDGIVTKGTDVLYPVKDGNLPLGGDFSKKLDDSNRLFTTVTTGGSYTFLSGGTLSIEFLYNGQGYNRGESDDYYKLRQGASDHFFDSSSLAGLSRNMLGKALNNGLPFLKRHYLMGQFQIREIKNVLDLTLRYAHNMEEGAGLASTIVEQRISDRILLFNLNTVAIHNGKDTEYNSIIDKSFMIGMEFHF